MVEGHNYVHFVNSENKEEIFEATHIPTGDGEVVHHKVLNDNEGKFLITNILLNNIEEWTFYNKDLHCIGSFLPFLKMWNLSSYCRVHSAKCSHM